MTENFYPNRMTRQRLWPVLVASCLGLAILCSLGVWQVKRLAWKEGLIAQVDERMSAQPVSLAEALKRRDEKQDIDYLRVRASGHYIQQPPLHRMSIHQNGPGFDVLQAFLSDDNVFVLINRGTVSTDDKQPVDIPVGTLNIEGLAQLHNKGQGLFDAENDATSNLWFWWDIPAMLSASVPPDNSKVAPFILQLLPSPDLPARPIVTAPKAELRNNHLGYALTWFGLAASLLVVTGAFVFRLRKPI